MLEGACSGECCRMMTLNLPPEKIALLAAGERYQRRFAESRRLELAWASSSLVPVPVVAANPDAEFVERHLVPVRLSFRDAMTKKLRGDPAPAMQYRCSAWDGVTRRCTRYSTRPDFCRTYGVEPHQRCRFSSCTFRPYPIWRDLSRWEDDGGPTQVDHDVYVSEIPCQ